MATTPTPLGTSVEASFLREVWADLENYEGKWIAVSETQIVGSGEALDLLIEETAYLRPLYAYVTFKPIQ